MKCIECILFITAEETGDEPGCTGGGDVSNPTKNIYCGEMDGEREDWEEKNIHSNGWEESKDEQYSRE